MICRLKSIVRNRLNCKCCITTIEEIDTLFNTSHLSISLVLRRNVSPSYFVIASFTQIFNSISVKVTVVAWFVFYVCLVIYIS
jgi:hypothetical protein